MFNKFKSSTCELPNNQCANHRLHKCSFCHKWGCKAWKHRANGPGHFNKSKGQKYQGHAHVVSNLSLSCQGSGNGDPNHPLVSFQTISVQIIACTNALFVTNGVAKHVTIEQMVLDILTSPKVKSTKAMLM